MNIKKLVSAVSALAIAGSAFAGLAVTASAASSEQSLTSSASFDSDGSTIAAYSEDTGHLTVNNTQFRDWNSQYDGSIKFNAGGSVALYTFDISDVDGTVTSATFTVTAIGQGDYNNPVNAIRLLGYNGDAPVAGATLANNGTNDISGTVNSTGTFQPLDTTAAHTASKNTEDFPMDMSDTATTYVASAVAEGKGTVTFAIASNMNRGLHLQKDAKLDVTVSKASNAKATFSATNGSEAIYPTVAVYSDEARNTSVGTVTITAESDNTLELLDEETYYYTATLYGYEDKQGSFTMNGDTPVEITMTEDTPINVTINAIDENSDVIKAIKTEERFKGAYTYTYPEYVVSTDGTKLYKATSNANSCTVNTTLDGTAAEVTYTVAYASADVDGIKYYYNEYDGATGIRITTFSNGGAQPIQNGVTVEVPEDGIYDVIVAYGGNTTGSRSFTVYKGTSTDGDSLYTNSGFSQYNEVYYTIEDQTLLTTDSLFIKGQDNNVLLDYVILVKTADLPEEPTPELPTANATWQKDYNDQDLEDAETGASLWKAVLEATELFYDTVNVTVQATDGEGTGSVTLGDTIVTNSEVVVYVAIQRLQAAIQSVVVEAVNSTAGN